MARIGLRNRIAKLEQKQHIKRRVARVAVEYRVDVWGTAVEPAVRDWLATNPYSVPDTLLGAYRGLLAPRVILVPVFDDWEVATERQQTELLALARSRHVSPTAPSAYPCRRADEVQPDQ